MILQVIILSIVQGITEFLPISSSAHLQIIPYLFEWQYLGRGFDISLHIGTLLAVVIYYRRDILDCIIGFCTMIAQRKKNANGMFSLYIIVSTLPIIPVGYVFSKFDNMLIPYATVVIGYSSIVFAILLWLADSFKQEVKAMNTMNFSVALKIGIAQVIALIPGASRSGVTMTMARSLGFDRVSSAKYSMLISIPTIIASGVLEGLKFYHGEEDVHVSFLVIGIVLSFVVALFSIDFLMKILKRVSFNIFVIYRVILGAFLLFLYYAY